MPKTLIKTPFEFNQVNSYLWNRQGKRHFWGIKGKDYGLIESPQAKEKRLSDHILPQIKREHVSVNPYSPKPPPKYQQFEYNQEVEDKRFHEKYQPETRRVNQYESQKPNNKIHFKTEPIQYFLPPKQENVNKKKQEKKAHLSLLTRNVNLNISEQDSLQRERQRINNKEEFSVNKGLSNNPSTFFQEKAREGRQRLKSELNNYGLDDYRDRIVRLVRKDRRNNPTFCNSLAYPLPCYRYLQ